RPPDWSDSLPGLRCRAVRGVHRRTLRRPTDRIDRRAMLEADEIEQIIPHRYPFLLVDRIIEIEAGKSGTGIKSVTANEWFFQGHFPGRKVMPGVLIIEALAQVAAVTMLKDREAEAKTPVFGGIDNLRFRRPV